MSKSHGKPSPKEPAAIAVAKETAASARIREAYAEVAEAYAESAVSLSRSAVSNATIPVNLPAHEVGDLGHMIEHFLPDALMSEAGKAKLKVDCQSLADALNAHAEATQRKAELTGGNAAVDRQKVLGYGDTQKAILRCSKNGHTM